MSRCLHSHALTPSLGSIIYVLITGLLHHFIILFFLGHRSPSEISPRRAPASCNIEAAAIGVAVHIERKRGRERKTSLKIVIMFPRDSMLRFATARIAMVATFVGVWSTADAYKLILFRDEWWKCPLGAGVGYFFF